MNIMPQYYDWSKIYTINLEKAPVKENTEDVCPPKLSIDLEAAHCDEPQSGRSFEEIPVQRSNPRLDIHRDFQRR